MQSEAERKLGDILREWSELRGWCRLGGNYDLADWFKRALINDGVVIEDSGKMRSRYRWNGHEWAVKFNRRNK